MINYAPYVKAPYKQRVNNKNPLS